MKTIFNINVFSNASQNSHFQAEHRKLCQVLLAWAKIQRKMVYMFSIFNNGKVTTNKKKTDMYYKRTEDCICHDILRNVTLFAAQFR